MLNFKTIYWIHFNPKSSFSVKLGLLTFQIQAKGLIQSFCTIQKLGSRIHDFDIKIQWT